MPVGTSALLAGRQLDVERTAQVDPASPSWARLGMRQITVQAHDRQSGGHDVRDYSWPRVRHAPRRNPCATGERLRVPWWWWPPGSGSGRADRAGGEPGRVRALPDWLPLRRAAARRRRGAAVVGQDRGAGCVGEFGAKSSCGSVPRTCRSASTLAVGGGAASRPSRRRWAASSIRPRYVHAPGVGGPHGSSGPRRSR